MVSLCQAQLSRSPPKRLRLPRTSAEKHTAEAHSRELLSRRPTFTQQYGRASPKWLSRGIDRTRITSNKNCAARARFMRRWVRFNLLLECEPGQQMPHRYCGLNNADVTNRMGRRGRTTEAEQTFRNPSKELLPWGTRATLAVPNSG